jgi:hypothetical protein
VIARYESTMDAALEVIYDSPHHPIFNPPGTTDGSSSVGQITSTRIGSRNIQLSLRYYF